MHNSIIHHLYILLCVYHPKSSLLPPPFIPPLHSSSSTHPLPSGHRHTIVCLPGSFSFLNLFTQSLDNYAFLNACIQSRFENIQRRKNHHFFFYIDSLKKIILVSCQRYKIKNKSNEMFTSRIFISMHLLAPV